MKYRQVANCRTYFGYGDIDCIINADSFSWEENEDITFGEEIEVCLNYHLRNRNRFLFATRTLAYPLGFKDKQYGLWRNYIAEHRLDLYACEEEKLDFKTHSLLYGMCRIAEEDFLDSVRLAGKMGSFIILSENEVALSECRQGIKKTVNRDELDFAYLINYFCNRGDTVITQIRGTDGATLNIFYLKH